MRTFLLAIVILLLSALLTIVTQVGGVILLLSILIAYFLRKRVKWVYRFWGVSLLFVLIYLASTFAIIPFIAPMAGRVALPCFSGNLKPLTIITCVCNRQYVRPQLKAVAEDAATSMAATFNGSKLYYLDANFPFVDGFPLIPHLSHNDGRKLDLAFYYKDSENSEILDGTPSFIGYGVFEDPGKGEPDKPKECFGQGQWQYGFMEKLIPQGKKQTMRFDETRTKAMLLIFAKDKRVKKMFLEPHLKQRLGLAGHSKIRYQGCHSVRHDDHVHVQL